MGSGTWDRSLQHCNACTWTHLSWSKQQNMKKLCRAKNNCVHAQLGQIMNKKIQKDQKTHKWPLLKIWEKNWCQKQKQGTVNAPLHSIPQSETEVAQSCPALCDPMGCGLPGSSVHGIFQAIVPEWIAISFSRGSSQPRD